MKKTIFLITSLMTFTSLVTTGYAMFQEENTRAASTRASFLPEVQKELDS